MKIDTLSFGAAWNVVSQTLEDRAAANLVLVFGDSDSVAPEQPLAGIRLLYPNAQIVGASSAGNVLDSAISDAPYVATAIAFEKSHVVTTHIDFGPDADIEAVGCDLISQLPEKGLRHVFVLSDGLNINGSALVRGMLQAGRPVSITGGMAGDGDRFQKTWVIHDGTARDRRVAAIGFYGSNLQISNGCFSGWSEFGADRVVTKSEGNVLLELEGRPALDLYKGYLGDYARDLPLSGMRFPLSIRASETAPEVIRTLLAIDEETRSITFAGDVPEGYIARLMRPDIDELIDGAGQAAHSIQQEGGADVLALVVSCSGRKIVMNDLVEEELDSISDALGGHARLAGFYSYGEIAPFNNEPLSCQLHNQTMTITGISEH